MADYSWGTKVTYRHEWTIPTRYYGAAIAEIHKAIHAADNAYRAMHPKKSDTYYSDDYLRVQHDDENIIIFFETDFPPPPELLENMTFNYSRKDLLPQ